jgi:hypothetical protein
MEKKLSWFDKLMMAITFAEAGEHDTAREMLATDGSDRSRAAQLKAFDIAKS